MKVQDVKKECAAIVGLSIEFSNSEVGSIDRLLWTVDNCVDKAINKAIIDVKETGKQYSPEDDVPVEIDLRSIKKIQWLLYQMTRANRSDLFNEASKDHSIEIDAINRGTKVF